MADTLTKVGMEFSVYNRGQAGTNSILGELGRLRAGFTNLAGAVGIGIGLGALGREMKSWIDAAKEADKIQRTFELTLGDNADAAGKWADRYAKSAGVCEVETKKFLGSFTMLAEEFGAGSDMAEKIGEQMTRLTNDMASFTRIAPEEAFQKIQMAMQGSYRGLRQMGIAMSEAKVKQYALTQGWITQGQELSELQKYYATFNVLLDETQKMHGDLGRSAGTAADQERRLKEEWQDLKRELGQEWMLVYRDALGEIHKTLTEHKQDLRDIVEGLGIAANAVLGAAGKMSRGTKAVIDAGYDLFPPTFSTYNPNPQMNTGWQLPGDAMSDRMDRVMAGIQNSGGGAVTIPSPAAPGARYGPRATYRYPKGETNRPAAPWVWQGFDWQATAGYVQPGANVSPYERMANPGGGKDTQGRVNSELSAYRHMYSQLSRMTEESYNARVEMLQKERDKYREFAEDKHLVDVWYEEQYRKLQIGRLEASDNFFGGFQAGTMQMYDELETLGQLGAKSARLMRDSWVDGTWEMITASKSLGDVVRGVGLDFAQMFYKYSMNQMMTGAMNWMVGGTGRGSIGALDTGLGTNYEAMSAFYGYHRGGLVGSDANFMRLLPASTLRDAPRLHEGLLPGEFPAILQRGERVIPRGGGSGPASDALLRRMVVLLEHLSNQPITVAVDGQVKSQLRRMADTRSVYVR
jgi:hypothetical protein